MAFLSYHTSYILDLSVRKCCLGGFHFASKGNNKISVKNNVFTRVVQLGGGQLDICRVIH